MEARKKRVFVGLVPIVALAVVFIFSNSADALHYALLLGLLVIAFFAASKSPQRMTVVFSLLIIAMLMTSIVTEGEAAKWAVLGVGLFCSVMWSNIFSLAIEGLGALKGQASSLLVMGIVGGALLPPIQGAIADRSGIQYSLIVPMIAFAYVAFYGFYGYRAGRKVGEVGGADVRDRAKLPELSV
jgi:FHS family L-fucose permease-like MFS transporter